MYTIVNQLILEKNVFAFFDIFKTQTECNIRLKLVGCSYHLRHDEKQDKNFHLVLHQLICFNSTVCGDSDRVTLYEHSI
jgi:hypothetical protein